MDHTDVFLKKYIQDKIVAWLINWLIDHFGIYAVIVFRTVEDMTGKRDRECGEQHAAKHRIDFWHLNWEFVCIKNNKIIKLIHEMIRKRKMLLDVCSSQ